MLGHRYEAALDDVALGLTLCRACLQKRMERLQMGGVAQTNDSIAGVSVTSRPGTPSNQAAAAGTASGFASPGTASPVFGSFNNNTAAQRSSLQDAPATGAQEAWTGSGLR